MKWRRLIALAAILAGECAAALAAAQTFDQAQVMRDMMAAQAPRNDAPKSPAPPASAPGRQEGQPGSRPAAPTGGSPQDASKTGAGRASQ